MNFMNRKLGGVLAEEAVKYMLKDPEKNMGKLVGWARKLCIREKDRQRVDRIDSYLKNPENNWNQYIKRLLREVHPNITKKLLVNLFFNASIFGLPVQKENEKILDCGVPWTIIIDPIGESGRKCSDSSNEESAEHNLEFEVMDKTISEGKKLGIFFYVFSGSEPLKRKKDIIKLCKSHDDCAFMAFTNGISIDWDFASDIQQLGNLGLILAVDGFKEQDDAIRGEGAYETVMNAMETLREFGCFYGFSACYGSVNAEVVASREFIELMIERGCRFGIYFNYLPVDGGDLNMMATIDQRAQMYRRVREIRKRDPIPVMDYSNDHEMTNGCMGAGQKYFHINANGNCEPCIYVRYSDVNIKEHSLTEALSSPLFKCYRKKQPFSRNPLRGCPLVDKPGKLKSIIDECKAQFTGSNAEASVEQLETKLEEYRKSWSDKAGELYKE